MVLCSPLNHANPLTDVAAGTFAGRLDPRFDSDRPTPIVDSAGGLETETPGAPGGDTSALADVAATASANGFCPTVKTSSLCPRAATAPSVDSSPPRAAVILGVAPISTRAGCINTAICAVPAAEVPSVTLAPAAGGGGDFAAGAPASSVGAMGPEAKLESESADDSVVALCLLMLVSVEPVLPVKSDRGSTEVVTKQLRETVAAESALLSGAGLARVGAFGSIDAPS